MNDRHETDFIRLAVIAAVVIGLILFVGLAGVYGPVSGGFGPLELGSEVIE